MSSNKRILISVLISNDEEIQKLNKEHLGKDMPTDVLAFNIGDNTPEGDYYLGDVVVNKEQAQRQAEEYGNSIEEEIAELTQHGILHLLGVHH